MADHPSLAPLLSTRTTMSHPPFPGLTLSLGLIWLLTGAMYKLFEGRPGDLPSSVMEYSPFDQWNTFRYAIVAELAIVGLVIAIPRVGWFFMVALFGVFVAALFPLWRAGETSCGCFGSELEIEPLHMMIVDATLAVLILFSGPWRLPKGSGLGALALLPLLAAAVVGPLLKLPKQSLSNLDDGRASVVKNDDVPEADENGIVAASNAGDTAAGDDEGAGADGDTNVESEGETAEHGAVPPDEAGGEEVATAEAELPMFLQLDVKNWEGENFLDLEIVEKGLLNMDQGLAMPGSHVIVYRQQCEVCQEHLQKVAAEQANEPQKWADKPIGLLRIIESHDTPQNNLCTVLPQGAQVMTLPALERGYDLTTPTSFDLNEEYVVENVVDVRKLLGH